MNETIEVKEEHFVRLVPLAAIDRFFTFAIPYIKRALDHTYGEFTLEDVRQACLNDQGQLWLICSKERVVAAAVTQVVQYPSRRHLRIGTIGGSNFNSWFPVFEAVLTEWALQKGCQSIEGYVRKGFVPMLVKDYNYKHSSSIVSKEI